MSILRRHLAPISPEAWEVIDDEARRVLKVSLAARKVVDFNGPKGLKKSAINVGRIEGLKNGPVQGVQAARRIVQPLIELRTSFELLRSEIDAIDRGSKDPDLEALDGAALRIAHAEDTAAFHGYEPGGIRGIIPASEHPVQRISDRYEEYPRLVAEALRLLRDAGVDGPYGIALGPRCYAGLTQATEHGYPVIELVRRLIDGPVIWAPAVDGAVVLSLRGGDFELTVGQDLSIGYDSHDDKVVRLFLMESLTFRVMESDAAVALRYTEKAAGKRT